MIRIGSGFGVKLLGALEKIIISDLSIENLQGPPLMTRRSSQSLGLGVRAKIAKIRKGLAKEAEKAMPLQGPVRCYQVLRCPGQVKLHGSAFENSTQVLEVILA